MLDKVKLALRLSGTALDGEVSDLINARSLIFALSVSTFRRKRDRPVKRWAIPFLIGRLCFYAKAEFGFNDDAERYRNAYDYLKCALSLTADYTEESEGK